MRARAWEEDMQRATTSERVETVERAHEESVVDALVLAFSRDPIARYAFPGPTQYRAGFRQVILGMGGAALDHGSAFASEGFGGVALWLPPGVGTDDGVIGAGMAHVPAERQEDMNAMMEEMGRLHPDAPHWYLPLIGVDPAAQGRGLGSVLLRHALARVDQDRLPAYLESTNPANVTLYERHGFSLIGKIQRGGAPPMFPMLREAR
jgi:ribosomal protein S18 acetylase RimI-like enzyme